MGRAVPNWLAGYMAYSAESESPDSYHMWTGLSVLSSALRRNVWVNMGIYRMYPNQFVILVGPAGRTAKSTCIRLGRHILQGVEEIIFGPDSLTREELIKQLAAAWDKKQSALVLHSTELSSLIEPSGIKMIQFLTDVYDSDDNPSGWKYSTKGQGKDVIHRPILNILAGTTASWIADEMPADVVNHGFASRTIFVYEDEPRFSNPFPENVDIEIMRNLIVDLNHISKLEGEFKWTEEARQVYISYYDDLQVNRPKDYRLESFHNRKRGHILKLAMLISIAEDDELVIQERDVRSAIEILDAVEVSMPKTFSAVGKYEHAADLERILKSIQNAGGMSMADIYSNNYFAAKPEDLMAILKTLQLMGKIRAVGDKFMPVG